MSDLLDILVRRGIVTADPADRDECCGLPRDDDGFCTYREGHPIYVDPHVRDDAYDRGVADGRNETDAWNSAVSRCENGGGCFLS